MKDLNFKTRMIYFGIITAVSLAFFALQLYANSVDSNGISSIVLLVLWGIMIAFGIGGLVYSIKKRDHHKK